MKDGELTKGSSQDQPEILDRKFPGWRSVEFFGPPGGGKSHLCSRFASVGTIVVAPFLEGSELRRAIESRDATWFSSLPEGLQVRLLKRRLKRQVREYMNEPHLQRLAIRLTRTTAGAEPAHRVGLIARALALSKLHRQEAGCRILFDEGVIKQIGDLLARAGDNVQVRIVLDAIEALISTYPGEKNAALVTANPTICLERQRARGEIIANDMEVQIRFHRAAETLLGCCEQDGWATAVISNP